MTSRHIRLQAPKTLRQSTFDLVKRSMLDGEYLSGQILSANSLAAELGISNSPVREALMDLTSLGLVEVVRNRGFRVRRMTEQDRREVLEMRRIVEVSTMERLADRGLSSAELAVAEGLANEFVSLLREERVRDHMDADHRFHMYLIGLLGNSRISQTVENLRDQTRICGAFVDIPLETLRACADEHLDLLDALKAQDGARVRVLMEHQLEFAAARGALVQNGPESSRSETSDPEPTRPESTLAPLAHTVLGSSAGAP